MTLRPADSADTDKTTLHAPDTGGFVGGDGPALTPDEWNLWRVCLHESGHAVVGESLGAVTTCLVALGVGRGLCYTLDQFSPFEDAVHAWAGRACEQYKTIFAPGPVEDVRPEQDTRRPFDFDTQPELKTRLITENDETPDDCEVVANYVCFPANDGWRFARVNRLDIVTQKIIDDNLSILVRVARELFARRLLGAARLRPLLECVTECHTGHFEDWSRNMLNELITKVESDAAAAADDYRRLVRELASGFEQKPDAVSTVLQRAGQTTVALRSDVERLQSRLRAYDVLNAARPELNIEADRLRGKIAAADAALAEAGERHAKTIDPLLTRLEQIREIQRASDNARAELFRGCDTERRALYDAAATRAAAACSRVSELRRLIDRGRFIDPAEKSAEADRERRMAVDARRELPDAERAEREALAARDEAEVACQRP